MQIVEHTIGGEATARCIALQGNAMGISNSGAFPRIVLVAVSIVYL